MSKLTPRYREAHFETNGWLDESDIISVIFFFGGGGVKKVRL